MRRAPLVLVVVVTAAACATDLGGPGDPPSDQAADHVAPFPVAPDPLPAEFTLGTLLTDEQLRGGQQITTAQVQAFLADHGSFLATYDVDGRSAAELIVDLSLDHGVSPLYMLARIQIESSLVGSGSDENLAAATGCACPDGEGCDPALGGFAAQVECGAVLIEAYYDELDADGVTRSGWAVHETKPSLDVCQVTPRNRATAALYTYTPWVGPHSTNGCGTDRGGSTLLALTYYKYWAEFPWGTDP